MRDQTKGNLTVSMLHLAPIALTLALAGVLLPPIVLASGSNGFAGVVISLKGKWSCSKTGSADIASKELHELDSVPDGSILTASGPDDTIVIQLLDHTNVTISGKDKQAKPVTYKPQPAGANALDWRIWKNALESLGNKKRKFVPTIARGDSKPLRDELVYFDGINVDLAPIFKEQAQADFEFSLRHVDLSPAVEGDGQVLGNFKLSYVPGKSSSVAFPGAKPGLYELALLKGDGKPSHKRAWIVIAGQKPDKEVLAAWQKERSYLVGKGEFADMTAQKRAMLRAVLYSLACEMFAVEKKSKQQQPQSETPESVISEIIKLRQSGSPDKQALAQEYYRLSEVFGRLGRRSDADRALASAMAQVEESWQDFDTRAKSTPPAVTRAVLDPRLVNHVVNTGDSGYLSTSGKFKSSLRQIDNIFIAMDKQHGDWQNENGHKKRVILLYAHGGLVGESAGLRAASNNLEFWLGKEVYPINFVWESGARDIWRSRKVDSSDATTRGDRAFGVRGGKILLSGQLVERVARRAIRPMWDDMKVRALQCSAPCSSMPDWKNLDENSESLKYPGATVTIDRLKKYVDAHPGEVVINLVSHSAGSIYSVGVLERMQEAGLKVHNLTFMAPAIRVCDYKMYIAPKLNAKMIDKVSIFNLSKDFEENDLSSIKGIAYPHSLLYLVARALETPGLGEREDQVPLLGLSECSNKPLSAITNETLANLLNSTSSVLIESSSVEHSRGLSVAGLACTATSHGGFGEDRSTLESIALLMQQ